jgi:hypothetical protein
MEYLEIQDRVVVINMLFVDDISTAEVLQCQRRYDRYGRKFMLAECGTLKKSRVVA